MNVKINIPSSFENKNELEKYIKKLIKEKFQNKLYDKSGISSLYVNFRKMGSNILIHFSMNYQSITFQLSKKDQNPYKAARLGVKGLRQMYLDNKRRLFQTYRINRSSEAQLSLSS